MAANIYTFRVHEKTEDVASFRARIIDFLAKLDGSYVICREVDANRPHYQGWVRTELKLQALRKRVKTAFPEIRGNEDYSIGKVKEFDRYQRYTVKGTITSEPDVVCMLGHGIDREYILTQYAEFWKQNVTIVRSSQTIMSAAKEWWEKAEAPTRRDLAAYICDVLTERNKDLNIYKIRNIINAVIYSCDPTGREVVLDEIVSRL